HSTLLSASLSLPCAFSLFYPSFPLLPPLSFHCSPPLPALPSFPTRRSSDLRTRSFDPADFPVPNGREEEWRFTPVKRHSSSRPLDRKSTRLNSSHVSISYAVFCLKKKKKTNLKSSIVDGYCVRLRL